MDAWARMPRPAASRRPSAGSCRSRSPPARGTSRASGLRPPGTRRRGLASARGYAVEDGQDRFLQQALRGHGKPSVGHPDVRPPAHALLELRREPGDRNRRSAPRGTPRWARPAAPRRGSPRRGRIRPGPARRALPFSVRLHRATLPSASRTRRLSTVDAMGGRSVCHPWQLTLSGAPDREGVVGLHDRHRAAGGIEVGDDLRPQGSRLHPEKVPGLVQSHRSKGPHVEHDPVLPDRVTAHAVPSARDRDGRPLLAGASQEVGELRLRGHRVDGDLEDLADGGLAEAARVVDRARGRRRTVGAIA